MKIKMEFFLINILLLYNLYFVLPFIPNWVLESQSKILFSSSSTDNQYEYVLYDKYGYVLKKIITKEKGKINSINHLTFSEARYSITQTVQFENIESTYYAQLGANRLVCPRGKFHPYDVESDSYIVPPSFDEEDDWDLSCYKHYTGYFIIFYINYGHYSIYFKKDNNIIEKTNAVNSYLFAYKLPEYQDLGHNHEYILPLIREESGNIILQGYSLRMNSDENQINGNEKAGRTILTKIKKNTRAIIDDSYNFYYFSYNDASDFTSGYSNTYLNLGEENYASSFQVTNNIDNSPLTFEDNVDIINMNFIPNTHYAYYKIYNKDKNITYYGLIDIKENKLLYNIEGDDITFIPDSSGQMIAITQTELYKICIIKDNDECYNIDQCPHIMLDPEGNKCQNNCDEGKIEMIPERICLNKHECNLNIYIFNEG